MPAKWRLKSRTCSSKETGFYKVVDLSLSRLLTDTMSNANVHGSLTGLEFTSQNFHHKNARDTRTLKCRTTAWSFQWLITLAVGATTQVYWLMVAKVRNLNNFVNGSGSKRGPWKSNDEI